MYKSPGPDRFDHHKALADSPRCCSLSVDTGRFLPGIHSQVDLYEMATTGDEAVGLLEAEEAGALGRRGVGWPGWCTEIVCGVGLRRCTVGPRVGTTQSKAEPSRIV